MQKNVFWGNFYHKFLVIFPVILIFILIFLVYFAYIFTYINILLNTNTSPFAINAYAFKATSSPGSANIRGITLIILTTTLLILLIISLLRTVVMDPGYFPSPINMEYKLILKNTNNNEIENKKEKFNKNNEILIEEEMIIRNKSKDKYRYLTNFEFMIKENPLTWNDSLRIKYEISKITNDKQNLKHDDPDISNDRDFQILIDEMNKNNSEVNTDPYDKFIGIDFTKTILCGNCLRWKPERSHHCRQCGRCVLKMDHHCPWLANCIGFKNYKFFLLTHLYGIILTFLVAVTYWEVIIYNNLDFTCSILTVFFSIFIYVTNLGLFAFLFWLFYVNWKLTFLGQTVIENADRERFPSTRSVNIYDLGPFKNFKIVFGNNPLFWFIPFFPNLYGEGIIFENNGLKSK